MSGGGLRETRNSLKRQRTAYGYPPNYNQTIDDMFNGSPPQQSAEDDKCYPSGMSEDDKPIYVVVICSGIGNCDFAAALVRLFCGQILNFCRIGGICLFILLTNQALLLFDSYIEPEGVCSWSYRNR